MKKILFTILALATVALCANATDLTGKRIYVNPGHGSFGPNDRPCATIPYPNLPTTGMPDTMGFYESNTDMWKCEYLGARLAASGATVMYSRTTSGPWPYTKVNGDYPDYTYDDYKSRADYTAYNRNLSEICEEVESNNIDFFISVHSNAATDGSSTNYPLGLYRGTDTDTTAHGVASKAAFQTIWPYRWEMFGAGFDQASYYSATNMNVRGDIDFYGSSTTRTSAYSGKSYTGYLGVLKHGAIGGLWEGYFHTYQPARHRALNHDYCHMEGIGYYRGIMDYFGADADTKGYICGTVKDMDTKINHSLFHYVAKSNDQWLPCNGATVTLKNADGQVLQTYQVDTLYNGLFAFYDLTPGTYYLDATCPGYFDLDDTQKATPVVVTANATTYPFLQLRDTAWKPDAVVYETYPDKSTATGLNGKYSFGAAQTASFASLVAGKLVRQVLVRDDNESYILALDTTTGAHASYIYKVNTLTGALIQQVSTEGTQGQYYPIYNIAFTADSILVGGNYEECQYTPSGTFRTYYWDMTDLTAAPTAWFTSQWAGNFNNANVGRTFAVSGAWKDATVYTDAQTIGSSKQFRVGKMMTDGGVLVSTTRNQLPNEFTLPLFGDYTALASANSDDQALVLGENRSIEYSYTTDAKAPTINFDMPGAKGAGCFRFGGKSVIAAPVMASGSVTGVKLYNYTADRAAYGTTTTDIAPNVATGYCSVKPLADGSDIVIYVATDTAIYRYTTAGQTQPVLANVYAYGLNASVADSVITFAYALNTDAVAATLTITNEADSVLKEIALTDLTAGAHTTTLSMNELPAGVKMNWGVEATAPEVGAWGLVSKQTGTALGTTRVFNAPQVNPESEYFGNIYLMNRAGASAAGNGLLVMNPDYTLQYTTPAKGGQAYGSPYRFAVAPDGYIFIGDWSDGHSGVYVADPADPQNNHTGFFAGSQNGSGVWSSNGVEEGSSTPCVHIAGKGADTKLYVYNEDPGSTLPTNGLCVYNIGQPDGTIAHSWDGAPSATINFAGQLNTNGNLWAGSKGIWVSQHRTSGNNNSSATSLRFYSWDGNCTYASHQLPVDAYDQLVIQGSLGSCFAVTPDESQLILRDEDKSFKIFNITWNDSTPTLALAYEYKTGLAADYDFLQMNWDYAGNLIVSGNAGVYVYAAPKEENTCYTPARESLVYGAVPVAGIALNAASATIQVGDTYQFEATILPEDATEKSVTWTVADATIATVDANGLVTGVAVGTTTVTATSVADPTFTIFATVTVEEGTGTGVDNVLVNGIYYADGMIYNREHLYMTVYTATGALVGQSFGEDFSMEGMPRGTYLVRANGVTIKFIR